MFEERGRYCWLFCLAVVLAGFRTLPAVGADANPVEVKKVLSGLNSPQSVAVRPENTGDTYEVFVAESGAGRIIKFASNKPDKRIDVVSGFSTMPTKDDSPSRAGAHSICFLDHLRLIVAGGDDDGVPFVRSYELAEPESPLTADQHKHEANVPHAGAEASFDAHIFRSMARTLPNDRVGDFLIVAAPVDGPATGLAYVPVRSGSLGDAVPARFKNSEASFQIGAMAVGESGYVTISTNSAADPSRPSRLAFFSPLDRKIVMQTTTELRRIAALAYSPKTGNLYSANSPAGDDGQAGIYRIDRADSDRATGSNTVKIADVRGATALTFAPDGALYVAASGDSQNKDAGTLWKITGGL